MEAGREEISKEKKGGKETFGSDQPANHNPPCSDEVYSRGMKLNPGGQIVQIASPRFLVAHLPPIS